MRERRLAPAALLPLVAALAAGAASPLVASAEELSPRRLDNGLEVLVYEKHTVPLVTIEVAVKTGAFTEDRETNGLSHLYEHLFFKGNARIPTQEAYMKRVSELGIRFNGTTGNERVNYFITLPSKNFAAGMRFMADALLTPLFNPDELDRERKVVIGEYDRNESNAPRFLHEAMGKAAYGDDYLRKNPLGVRETILRATRETMVRFKETYYVPNNSILSIVGDVNPTEAQALVERHFGPAQWRQGDDPHAHPRAPLPRLEQSKAVVVARDNAVPTLAILWNGPDTDRDPAATYAGDLLGALTSQAFGRFQKTFRDGNLATQTSLSYFTQREGGQVHFNASALKKSPLEVRDALLREIAAMAEDPAYFTDEELGRAKQTLHVNRAYEAESGEQLSHAFTFHWASASLSYYVNYLSETDRVGPEDVQRFVRNYVAGRPCVIGFLNDRASVEKDGPDEKTLLGTPPEQHATGIAAAVRALTLPNGVRAIVRHDPQATIGALEVFVDGGSAFLSKETQGLERFALACALQGPAAISREEFQKLVVASGSRLGQEFTQDLSRVGLQAPMERFEAATQLLAVSLEKPALLPEAVQLVRDEVQASLRKDLDDADRRLWHLANELYYEGHAYANRPEGTPETVKGFDEAAIRAALSRALAPKRVVLVVVSALPHERAQQVLEERFAWIKAPEQETAPAKLEPVAPARRVAFEKRATKTTYLGGKFPLPAPGDPAHPAAKVLMNVLQKRFWEALRTKNPLSYAPYAGISSSRSNFGVVYATSTEPRKCVEVMFQELRRVRDELVGPEELRGVLAEDATRRASRSEASQPHAVALGTAELLGGSWRRHYEENQDLARVTAEQVREVARKFLGDVRWGVLGPEPVDEAVLSGGAPAK